MNATKRRWMLFAGLVLLVVLISVLGRIFSCGDDAEPSFSRAVTEEEISASEETAAARLVYVYLTGAVRSPGLYALPEDSRLYELLEQAGGFSEDADRDAVNLAVPVTDGQHVRVPRIGETVENAETNDETVNVNTADRARLMTLPGIGEVKADAIIEYRRTHGAFHAVEELLQVSGIGEAVLARIRDRIRI